MVKKEIAFRRERMFLFYGYISLLLTLETLEKSPWRSFVTK
jgi:hypothetical protein